MTVIDHSTLNPPYYQHGTGGAEAIDIAEHLNFNRGNAVKYLCRAGRKPGQDEVTDLLKAKWYLLRELNRLAEQGTKLAGQPPIST